jgi:hypothetical protein
MPQATMGPPVAIDGPLPVAPEYALLSAVTIVEDADPHWLMGGDVWGYPSDLPQAIDPCATGTFAIKDEGGEQPRGLFGSYALYLPITCTASGIDQDTFQDRALLAFRATESYGVAHELAFGTANQLNPFLADGNGSFPAGNTALSAQAGLSYLEDAIGGTGRQGLIHATPATGTAWSGSSLLQTSGGRMTTVANGTPVALDGGYIGAQPAGHTAPAAGQAWAFATGPVQVRRTEVFLNPPTLREALDREINEVTYRAERGYLTVWDTALQAAVLIDWTP